MAVDRQSFEDAIAAYWGVKGTQNEKSVLKGAVGAGTAGKVRSGQHFDPVARLIARMFLDADFPPGSIRIRVSDNLELPGYYRAQKRWDVVVAHQDTLVAAFELKALGGPSFGNNFNNRVEEALGSAVDVRRARLAELYPGEKPWLGYFFIMEDAPGSRSSVKLGKGPFPVEDIWLDDCCLAAGGKPCGLPKKTSLHGTSYQRRFAVFCERLVEEQLYDAACFITSSEDEPAPKELSPKLDWRHFSAAIAGRIAYLRELGIPAGAERAEEPRGALVDEPTEHRACRRADLRSPRRAVPGRGVRGGSGWGSRSRGRGRGRRGFRGRSPGRRPYRRAAAPGRRRRAGRGPDPGSSRAGGTGARTRPAAPRATPPRPPPPATCRAPAFAV